MSVVKLVNNPNGNCRLYIEKDSTDNMVACDNCDRWYHINCAKLQRIPTEQETWMCAKCIENQNKWFKRGQTEVKPVVSNDIDVILQESHDRGI